MLTFINGATTQFENYKQLADKAIAQLTDKNLHYAENTYSNSIAIIIQHMYGNMLSRWTDFLKTDGEMEWRNRDAEFEITNATKAQLLQQWETGWNCLFTALKALTDNDLNTIVYIRNIGQTVQDAIIRQLCHYSYHVGQIVFIAKIITNENWQNLSIAKNESAAYNKIHFENEKSIKHNNFK